MLVRYTPIKSFLTTDQLGRFLGASGLYSDLYPGGMPVRSRTVLGALDAIIFGTYWGFFYVWVGAMLGASAAFFIGRYLGREFTASIIGDKLKRYDDAIERNGFATVLYLRLVYFPFTPMNFGMGLTKVRFWDYLFGTGLGIIVGTFIYLFFIGTLKEVWSSGNWGELLSLKVIVSITLFVFSLFIPKIIKKLKPNE